MWQMIPQQNVILADGGSDMEVISFDDSEQFEEDSVYSWGSENNQMYNWSIWKASLPQTQQRGDDKELGVSPLLEISSRCVARNYAFEIVESFVRPIPENLQLRIAFWSFPESEEEICLYSCLANGCNEKYRQGETLLKAGNVRDVLQIGFHLSGKVTQPVSLTFAKQIFNVSISFDRGKITSCQCTCYETATWCEHTVAVCLFRIYNRKEVVLRAPVSESLSRLKRDQLQKFAQYLISELPQQILPTAQRLLDELLSSQHSSINMLAGAPDPTAGASMNEVAKWVLDEISLKESVKKVLAKFFGPMPVCVVDMNAVALTSAPAVSLKWSNFIRSLQRKDPEAMWNLLTIVRHMFGAGDKNAAKLLQYITEECLLCYHMMQFWVASYASFQGNNCSNRAGNTQNSFQNSDSVTRYASAHLMEEIVHLWQLAVMDPYIPVEEKEEMRKQLEAWNKKVAMAAKKGRGQVSTTNWNWKASQEFKGFNEAISASNIDWKVFYRMLDMPYDSNDGNMRTLKSSPKDAILNDSTVFKMFTSITSKIPDQMEEFGLMNVLTQSLNCHGFLSKSSKLASMLAQRILSTYPEKLRMGENNFRSLTERANNICEILLNTDEYERTAFQIAMLGLTAPRLPARSNLEEVKISYLEMSLYEKLKGMKINNERLTLIRYQARKLLTCPMLRGEDVLPLLLATFIFEVLCQEHVTSTVLQAPCLTFIEDLNIMPEDEILGYNCGIKALGLLSNAVDQKQPMLCESLRHQRRDLALALIVHSRLNNSQVDAILQVLLNKERYSFMVSKQEELQQEAHSRQPICNGHTQIPVKQNGGTKKKKPKQKSQSPVTENAISSATTTMHVGTGINFAGILAAAGPPPSTSVPTTTGRPVGFSMKFSSDSDSGNGDAQEKQSPSRHHALRNHSSSSTSMAGRKAQQRRHARQSSTKTKSESKHLRNERKHPKSSRSRKLKSSRELTESDSGQEMHFSFDNEAAWSSVPEGQDIGSFSSNSRKHHKTRISYFKDSSRNERTQNNNFGTKGFSSYNSNSSNDNTDHMEGSSNFTENIPVGENSFDINRTSGGFGDGQGFVTEDFSVSSSISSDNMIPLLPPVDSVQAHDNNSNNDAGYAHDNNDNDDAGYAEDFNIDDDIFNHKIAESSPRDLENHRMLETEISVRNQFQYEEFNTSKTVEMSMPNNDVSKHAQQTPVEEKPRTKIVMYAATKEDSVDLGIVSEDPSINSKHSSSDSLFNEPNSDHSTSPFSDIISVSRLEEKQETEQQVAAGARKEVDEKPAAVEISCSKPEERERITENKDPTLLDKQNIESKPSGKQNIESKQNTERKPWNKNNSLNLSDLKEALDSVSLKEDKAAIENQIKSCSLPNLSSASVSREASVSSSTATRNSMSTVELSNTGNDNEENVIVEQKPKKNKSKKKKNKAKLTMNVQSIEAEAYSMFELAKSVLLQSRNTVLVRPLPLIQPVNVGVNQKLQVAAFEIGLFALHIQNYSSPNWRARTYSTYVSWIENLAIDIGSVAQQILNEKWEGTLTPGEAIQVATRASRSGDQTTRRTAAELVLSCLPYAQSLSSTDITNSISLCGEQDEGMLERACSAVENASLNGGIQPELLFFISRKWHDLYKEKRAREQGENNDEAPNQQEIGLDNPSFSLLNNSGRQESQTVYMTPAEFVQEQMHIQAQEMLGRQIPRNTPQDQFTWMYPQYIGPLHHCPLPQQAIHSRRIPNIESYSIPYNNFPEELNLSEIPRHLQNCYRVGMKAMEALTLPLPDDRPEFKYAMSPPSSDDIRWMCKIAASLGPTCLKKFCKVVYSAVTSPYLLHDLALEAARNFALYNPAQLNSHLRSPSVSPIVHKAMAMYTELVHHDLVFLSSRGHSDFVDLLRRARSAFCMAAGGMARFNEILEVIRKTYPKKRELWQLIMNGLSKA